jgi:hypothetical protein
LPIFDPKQCYNPLSPQSSTDLSPPDYFLFPKLKIKLKGPKCTDVAEIHESATDELKKVQKQEFSAAFQKMFDCANPYTYNNGGYFE